MTVLLVLTVLTACRSSNVVSESTSYQDALINMIPSLPEVPDIPVLNWQYRDGMYCLCESDVDLFLEYKENTLPYFRWKLQQYQRKLDAVLSAF